MYKTRRSRMIVNAVASIIDAIVVLMTFASYDPELSYKWNIWALQKLVAKKANNESSY